jgi:hypothetical protein
MTRTDVMASSRPRTTGAAPKRNGSSGIVRALTLLPVLLALALALAPGAAFASEPTAGYENSEPNKPSTGTLPSKESEKPSSTTPGKEAEPESTSTTPTSGEEATTLPFTGFDLRWDVGFGLLLIAAGLSIIVLQRRQRRSGR